MNHEAVYRTAPATPCLLTRKKQYTLSSQEVGGARCNESIGAETGESKNNEEIMEEEADTGEGEANLGKEEQKQENVEADMFISKAIRLVEFGNWPRIFLKEKKRTKKNYKYV